MYLIQFGFRKYLVLFSPCISQCTVIANQYLLQVDAITSRVGYPEIIFNDTYLDEKYNKVYMYVTCMIDAIEDKPGNFYM